MSRNIARVGTERTHAELIAGFGALVRLDTARASHDAQCCGTRRVRRLPLAVLAAMTVAAVSSSVAAQAPAWSLQSPTMSPSARSSHGMTYDEHRSVTVLFGGSASGVCQADTWEWNGTDWVQSAATGPTARCNPALAYDSMRGVTVLFGGILQPAFNSGETWEWDGATWTQRLVSGPSPRNSHSMVYDPQRGVVVLFGGDVVAQGGVPSGETWEWDGTLWSQRMVAGPSPRYYAAMTYDADRGVTVLFGGFSGDSQIHFNDTWEWDGTAWTQRFVSGPSARREAVIAYDALQQRTVLYGGWNGATYVGDAWHWDGEEWAASTATGPSPRSGAHMSFDVERGTSVLFGGVNSGGPNAETWHLGVPCIAPPTITAQPLPSGTCPGQDAMFSVGVTGFGSVTYLWQIEVAPGVWTSLSTEPAPIIFCSPGVLGLVSASSPFDPETTISVSGCAGSPTWSVRCVVSNVCGDSPSDPTTLAACPADLDCSGGIDLADLLTFLGLWNTNLGQSVTPRTSGDFNGNGVVDLADLLAFLNLWNPSLGTNCP